MFPILIYLQIWKFMTPHFFFLFWVFARFPFVEKVSVETPRIKKIKIMFGEQDKRWHGGENTRPPTNLALVQIPELTPYVGWVCCWFSPLLREVFLRVLRFSPLLQHFQRTSNTRRCFNKFIRIPECFVGKQITIYNFTIKILKKVGVGCEA